MRRWEVWAWWPGLDEWVRLDGPRGDPGEAKRAWKFLAREGGYYSLRHVEFRDGRKPRVVREYDEL